MLLHGRLVPSKFSTGACNTSAAQLFLLDILERSLAARGILIAEHKEGRIVSVVLI